MFQHMRLVVFFSFHNQQLSFLHLTVSLSLCHLCPHFLSIPLFFSISSSFSHLLWLWGSSCAPQTISQQCVSVVTQDGWRERQEEDGVMLFADELWPAFMLLTSCIVSTGVLFLPHSFLHLSPPSLHTELLGCEMWKTAAYMAIHYLVKLPRASFKPQGERKR